MMSCICQREVDHLVAMETLLVVTATNQYHLITGTTLVPRSSAFHVRSLVHTDLIAQVL